jgi:L-idonate 5-dehydrogenase
MQGGFSTLFDARPAQCVPIPSHVSYAEAALAEPLAVCLHAVARAGDIDGRRVLVVGAGPIGLLTLLAAKARGAETVAISDLAAMPLAFAARLGANAAINIASEPDALTVLGAAFDIVFEASGSPAGLASALRASRRGGIVVQIGNQPAGDIPFPANMVMAKEIDLRGSFRFGEEFRQAVALIASGAVDVGALVTATLPLEDAAKAMHLAQNRSAAIKVVLVADQCASHREAM